MSNSKKVLVTAEKEIIICAGAFNTPQILMQSGIGPKEELAKFQGIGGYEVVFNSPGVGKNLQDRYEVSVLYELDDVLETTKECKYKTQRQCYHWRPVLGGGYAFRAHQSSVIAGDKRPQLTPTQPLGFKRGTRGCSEHAAPQYRSPLSSQSAAAARVNHARDI